MRRCDDPRPQGDLVLGAEGPKTPVLDHAKQLGLELHRHLGDLVEQDRPGPDDLELPPGPPLGPRERAAFVPEDERLDERPREGRAVDRHERVRLARARLVQSAGDELLAGARLAAQEDRRVGVGDAAHEVPDGLHRARRPDDGAEAPRAIDLLPQLGDLAPERQALAEALDDRQDHLGRELVLQHVVLGPVAHRLADLLELHQGRDHDRRDVGPVGPELPQQVQAAAVAGIVREADVEQEQVWRGPVDGREGLLDARRLAHLEPVEGREHHPQDAPCAPLVVNDECLHGLVGATRSAVRPSPVRHFRSRRTRRRTSGSPRRSGCARPPAGRRCSTCARARCAA